MQLSPSQLAAARSFLGGSIEFAAPPLMAPGQENANAWAKAISQRGVAAFKDASIIPSVAASLRKFGHHDQAKIADDHHAERQAQAAAAKAATPAPVMQKMQVTNTTPVPGYVGHFDAAARRKAIMSFATHPGAATLVDAHKVNVPGIDKKEALKRAEAAYEAYHAQQAPQHREGGNDAIANVTANATRRQKRTPQQVAEIAAKMGLIGYGAPPAQPAAPAAPAPASPPPVPSSPVASTAPAPQPTPVSPQVRRPALAPGTPVSSPPVVKPTAARATPYLDALGAAKASGAKGQSLMESFLGATKPHMPRPVVSPPGDEYDAGDLMARPASPRGRVLPPRLDGKTGRSGQSVPQQAPAKEYSAEDLVESPRRPTTHGRFASLIQAAKQGNLKEHLENGIGDFFQKFDEAGHKLLKPIVGESGVARSSFENANPANTTESASAARFPSYESAMADTAQQWADYVAGGHPIPAKHAAKVMKLLASHGHREAEVNLNRRMNSGGNGVTHFSRSQAEAMNWLLSTEFGGRPISGQASLFGDDIATVAKPKPASLTNDQRRVLSYHTKAIGAEDRDPRNRQIGRGFADTDRVRGLQLGGYNDPTDEHYREMASILSRHESQVPEHHRDHVRAVASQYDGSSIRPTSGDIHMDTINSVGGRPIRLKGVQDKHRAAIESLKDAGAKPQLYGGFWNIHHDGADKTKLAAGLGKLYSQGVQAFSREDQAAINTILEFARIKPSDRQRGFVFGDNEGEVATKAGKKPGWIPPTIEPKKNQGRFGWDEEKHPRVKTAHDKYRPGEFAPKDDDSDEHIADIGGTPVDEQPQQTKQGGIPITLENYGRSDRWYAMATLPDGTDVTRSDPDPKEARKLAEETIRKHGHEPMPEGGSTPSEMTTDELVDHLADEKPEAKAEEKTPKQSASPIAKPNKSPPTQSEAPNWDKLKEVSGGEEDPEAPAPDDDDYGDIKDFGEKIGGARKDTASKLGKRGGKSSGDSKQPGWMKNWAVAPLAEGADKGKFVLIDLKSGRNPLRGMSFAEKDDAWKMAPVAEVAKRHRTKNLAKHGEPDNFAIFRDVSDRKKPVIKDGFKTDRDAMQYILEHAAEILATPTRITDSIHPELEDIVREGKSHRPKGRHATEEDYKAMGFRGVEFGKWVNNAEGRHILDHAYDALNDMADALGVPTKALSLDGDLALGFGSRGKGNTGWGGASRAHYERNYGVINMTKIKGAGSLAHEWMHAMDHWLGRNSGKAKNTKVLNHRKDEVFQTGERDDDYVSHGFLRTKADGFRGEVADAFNAVMDAVQNREMKYKEDRSLHERRHEKRTEALAEQLEKFRKDIAKDYTGEKYQYYKGKRGLAASPEIMKQVDELIGKISSGDYGEDVRHGESSGDTPANSRNVRWGHSMPANVAKLADLHKQHRGNKGYSVTAGRMHGIIADIKTALMMHRTGNAALKDAQEQKEKTGKVRSEFFSQAERLDSGQKTDYWSTKHEMAARAFESYIYDKIKAKGGRSDYLAYEKHNELPQYKIFNVKPFPEGEERTKINGAFDHLFSLLSKHELNGEHRSKVVRPARDIVDDGTWRGHLESTGQDKDFIDRIERLIEGREGVLHLHYSKGVPTKSAFYSASGLARTWPSQSLDEHVEKIKSQKKGGKTFAVRAKAKEFSRAAAPSPMTPAVATISTPSTSVAPVKKPRKASVKFPDFSQPPVHPTQTPEFKSWHYGSQVVNEDGTPKVVYHGARRADRIAGSGKFDPKRATSGPMSFFTDDPEIAKGYATGKQDTSMEMPDSYAQHFKLRVPGYRKPVDIDRAWHALPHEQRAKISAIAPRIGTDDETGENFEIKPEGHASGNGGYDHAIKEHRGNALKALVDSWLDSGSLYGQEHRFLDVLKHAGVEGAEHHDPHAEYPAIFPAHLSIRNPLHTTAIPDEIHAALAQASKRQRGKQGSGSDPWDKRYISGNDFMSRLAEDRANNTTHAWTSIPDWVTQTLQRHGYDGIRDNGGKYNQKEHSVWIPFQPHQVKSPFNKTFDPANQKFNFSRGERESIDLLLNISPA